MSELISAAFVVGTIVACLCLYFLPALIGRNKRNANAIFVLNLFVGWTFLGWLIALVWACCHDAPAAPAPAK